jgi:glycosyltransferase involved in cell wall biosynthesis
LSSPAHRQPGVTLLVFAMNEIDGMRVIMPRVRRDWVDQILIVDGQSTDGSQEYAQQHGYEMVVQSKAGGRHAFNEAFPLVRHDVVVTFAPNGKLLPELIPALIEEMRQGRDMVIASRYLGPAHSYDDHLASRFANWFFTTAINRLFGGRYTDAMNLYRAYRTELFWSLALEDDSGRAMEKLLGTVLGIEPLLSIRAAKKKLVVAEIPGDEPTRIGGVDKFPKVTGGLGYLVQMVREVWHWR